MLGGYTEDVLRSRRYPSKSIQVPLRDVPGGMAQELAEKERPTPA